MNVLATIDGGGRLIRYEAACTALAAAKSVDEVKDIRDQALAMAAYARQAKNHDLEADALEIRMRATRRLDQLREAQKETVGLNRGLAGSVVTGLEKNPVKDTRPTLASQGIDKNLAHQARRLGAMSEDKFEAAVSNARASVTSLVRKVVRGTEGTGENEWYTPQEYIEAARDVLGDIDLDPATSREAQKAVNAIKFFTTETNGLEKPWRGRVWLNPPYAQPAISHFADKMVEEVECGNVSQAIMLTHNYTDTAWFQKLAAASGAICFTRGRIRFVSPDGELAAPTQGQAFFYFGDKAAEFTARFREIGFVALISRGR